MEKYVLVIRCCVRVSEDTMKFFDVETDYVFNNLKDAVDKKYSLIEKESIFGSFITTFCYIDCRFREEVEE